MRPLVFRKRLIIEWCKENQGKMGLDKFGNIIFINACKHNKEPFL